MTSPTALPVVIRVFDIPKDVEIRQLKMNYNSKHARNKVLQTIFWALNSGHAIELVREQDDKPLRNT